MGTEDRDVTPSEHGSSAALRAQEDLRIINSATIETRHRGSLEFILAKTEDGQFIAYRTTEPFFCFERPSLESVADVAVKSIDSWIAYLMKEIDQPRGLSAADEP